MELASPVHLGADQVVANGTRVQMQLCFVTRLHGSGTKSPAVFDGGITAQHPSMRAWLVVVSACAQNPFEVSGLFFVMHAMHVTAGTVDLRKTELVSAECTPPMANMVPLLIS